ncbi:MAG: peroxiredoxin [Planctomycetaceae bacterium]|nr:peroxiredoxin [Planctomycetaceae bacterium]|tara:strand:+ start:1324 stop:1791 length:468 start_codon:yes stop_codon:yes gene_type:complete
MTITVGQKAPAFSLPDQDGNQISLENFRGQNLVLYFYPKDDTPGCTKQAQGFRDLNSEFETRNTVVIGVSPDGAESHNDFICKYELPFILLCDEDKVVLADYEAWGERVRFGKRSMGVIRSAVLIDGEGIVRNHWSKIADAGAHPQEVLNSLSDE